MAKRKYAAGLSPAERHRISDALYRLRKQGFYIPDEEVKKIKNAATYKDIEKKAVRLPGAYYQPERQTKAGKTYKSPAQVDAALAYDVITLQKSWIKDRKKYMEENPDMDMDNIPIYEPSRIGPSAFETSKMTQKQINEAFAKRFKDVKKTLKKKGFTVEQWVAKSINQTIENLDKSIKQTIKPVSNQLYRMIISRIKAMSPVEFYNFYKQIGRKYFDAFFIYPQKAFLLGVDADGTTPISKLLKVLDIPTSTLVTATVFDSKLKKDVRRKIDIETLINVWGNV